MEGVLKGETARGLTWPAFLRDTIRPSGLTCAPARAGAHRPAASIPSRSPSSRRTPQRDRSRPDPEGTPVLAASGPQTPGRNVNDPDKPTESIEPPANGGFFSSL